ncbi:MAG: NUDIX domain-containing protein [Bacteroidota bacterium]
MTRYNKQTRLLAAVDCIIFGFDGTALKLLVIKRAFEPEKGKWSLMGGFVQQDENCLEAANRVLTQLTGLNGVYMEQLRSFSKPNRDPKERTISIAYYALIDIHQYEKQISDQYHPEWFELNHLPELIFDHNEMVEMAIKRLRYKAAIHPILFELLPQKFTIPQLQILYEAVYGTEFDKRNFSRKLLSTGLLVKQKDKDKESSKKGAFYYKLDKKQYESNFQAFLNFIPNPHNFI